MARDVCFGTLGDIDAGMKRMAAFEREADVISQPGPAYRASHNGQLWTIAMQKRNPPKRVSLSS